jgi:hypothetical protein
MRGAQVRAAAAAGVAAALIAGCGADKSAPPPAAAGKVVHGQTESGMKLTVATFVAPSSDPQLARLDAYRAAGGYPSVDYHRVTADNTHGSQPDRERDVTFARTQNDIAVGKGSPTSFACDALRYQWPPQRGATRQTHDALMKTFCAVEPSKPDGIAAGAKQVYYLVSDRSFGQRGIRSMNVYGPLSAQLK